MEHRISATDLARRLGDILGRVRYRGDSFIVERNGDEIARVVPIEGRSATSLREAATVWLEAGGGESSFADDLERIGELDQTPLNPWGS